MTWIVEQHLRELRTWLAALPPEDAVALSAALRTLVQGGPTEAHAALEEAREIGRLRRLMADVATRRATAYHEAGHAVSAIVLGLPLLSATIDPDPVGGSLGHCRFRSRPGSDPEADAVCELAGPYAERHGTFREPHAATWAAHTTTSAALLVRVEPPLAVAERMDRLRALHGEAEALVATHWRAIEAVAAALLDRTTLDRAALDTLLFSLTEAAA